MLRTIVIDDEKPSNEVICNYLRDYCKDVRVVATASSVKSGYIEITKHNPDLVFLDIELSDGSGFDLITLFPNISFKIIFVTAFSEHAVKAFRVNAVDYLLKPVKIDELKASIEKAKKFNAENLHSDQLVELFKSLSAGSTLLNTLLIPHIKGFDVLKVPEIIMCKADGYCTEFYLTGKRKIVSSKNLKHFENFLTQNNFLRVHNSFIINLNHVCSYSRQGEIELTEDNKASLSDANRHKLLEKLSPEK